VFGRVIAVYLVDDLGVRLERAKAVGKPFRHEQLVAFGRAQHDCDMAAVARRAPADVDRDIEDRAFTDAYQLCLGGRRSLEMQAAHDAGVDRQRMVFLNERSIDAVLAQHILAKDLGEKAARIAVAHRPDFLYLGDLGRNDMHAAVVLRSGIAERRPNGVLG